MTLPFRTSATWLTDDDLILLDTMFNCGMPYWALRRDGFGATLNYPYTHGYDDEALKDRLELLRGRGLIRSERGRDDDYFSFTPSGGALWSMERLPIWDRYCMATGRRIRPDHPNSDQDRIVVKSPSREICGRYLDAWAPPDSRRRLVEARRRPLLWWRSFDRVFAGIAVFPAAPVDASPSERVEASRRWRAKWDAVEAERDWWREIGELQRFVPGDKSASDRGGC